MKRKVRNRRRQPLEIIERPDWLEDPRELARRLPAFAALEAVGALTRQQREMGDRFAAKRRLALEHCPAVTARYGGPGGHDVGELEQHQARLWLRSAMRRAGRAGRLLEALADDERPLLTERDVLELRAALDAIAVGSRLDAIR